MLRTIEKFGTCLSLGLLAVGLFCAVEGRAFAAIATGPVTTEDPGTGLGGACSPTDTSVGSPPCHDKAGGQCTYGGKASSCTSSPNGSNCTCGAVGNGTDEPVEPV